MIYVEKTTDEEKPLMYYYQSNVEIQQNRQTYESMYDPNHILVPIDKWMDWNSVYQLLEPFYPSTPLVAPRWIRWFL